MKWRHIDVRVFSKLPRVPEHCHYLIEAKRLGAGVEGALDQAIGLSRSSAFNATSSLPTASAIACMRRARISRPSPMRISRG